MQRDGLVAACDGLGEAPQCVESGAVIRECHGVVRPLLQRAGDQLDRFIVAALLMFENAEEMWPVKMIGRDLQDLSIYRLGVAELAALMQRDGIFQVVVDTCGQGSGWDMPM